VQNVVYESDAQSDVRAVDRGSTPGADMLDARAATCIKSAIREINLNDVPITLALSKKSLGVTIDNIG